MEKLACFYFVVLVFKARCFTDATVVKTNAATNEFEINEPANTQQPPLDTDQDKTQENAPKESMFIPLDTFGNEKAPITEEDILALVEIGAEKPQVFNLDTKEFPLNTGDFSIKKGYNQENIQNLIKLSKKAALTDDEVLGMINELRTMQSLQNPLQIHEKNPSLENGLFNLANIMASQGTLSQMAQQDSDHAELEDGEPEVLKCHQTEGSKVVVVPCTGSCYWSQPQWSIPRVGCSPQKHKTDKIWYATGVVEYCNTNLCN